MRRFFLALLLAGLFLAATVSEVEDAITARTGKDASCIEKGTDEFLCTVNVNREITITCDEGCVLKLGSFEKTLKPDAAKIFESSPWLACGFLEASGIEGCSCNNEGSTTTCKLERMKANVECSEDECTATGLGMALSFSLKKRVSMDLSKDGEIVKKLRDGEVRIRKVGDEREVEVKLSNLRGHSIKIEGRLPSNLTRAEMKAAIVGDVRSVREKIRKFRRSEDFSVLQAVDFDPENMRMSDVKLTFEIPCEEDICDRDFEVWHIKDDGSSELVDANIRREGDFLIIEVEPKSFSIYALATVGQISGESGGEIPLKPETPTNSICIAGLLLPLAAGRFLKK